MERDFAALCSLYEEKKEKFSRFYALLLEYNARFNLTAITEEREVFYKHFLDSLAGVSFFPPRASVCEVGSGAGFPSVPLMIVREDLRFTLIESVGKKCAFLRTAVKELGLFAEVKNMRAEDAGRDSALREKFDVCCARAVARLDTLAEYCLPLVKKGGTMIAYKGSADERKIAANALGTLGGKEKETVFYELPEGYGRRSLVVIEKIRKTPETYPRGNGAERRNPL